MKHLYLRWWLLAALLLVTAAWAQTTPAGVIITNQASADFVDSTGDGQTTLSNAVEVVVLPVYSFNVEPDAQALTKTLLGALPITVVLTHLPTPLTQTQDNTLTGVNAGDTVQFNYTLDNDANVNDVFDLEVRQDADDDFDFTGIQIYTFDDLTTMASTTLVKPAPYPFKGATTASISLAADDGAGEKMVNSRFWSCRYRQH